MAILFGQLTATLGRRIGWPLTPGVVAAVGDAQDVAGDIGGEVAEVVGDEGELHWPAPQNLVQS